MDTKRLIDLFIDLVKIDAVSGFEKPAADFISNYLYKLQDLYPQNISISVSTDDSQKYAESNTGNLICKIGKPGNPNSGGDFVLLSHMDSVLSTSGLIPVITDDSIKTSGDTILAADNRAGIAAILYAVTHAAINNIPIKDFTIAFTTCEETSLGGSLNIKLPETIKHGYVFDSSYRPGKFIYAATGAMTFIITIKGKSAHSGIEPEKGVHAIQIAANAISSVKMGRVDEETTLNIGKISGGSATNVIPEITQLYGEIRSFNKDKIIENSKSVESIFKNKALEYNGTSDYSDRWDFEPYTHSLESELIKSIEKAISDSGIEPVPTKSFGGSDANSLNQKGIPAVNIGIGAQNPHSVDEFILIEDLVNSSKIALNLIKA